MVRTKTAKLASLKYFSASSCPLISYMAWKAFHHLIKDNRGLNPKAIAAIDVRNVRTA